MKKIKKGDIVGRISYNKDILFVVSRVIQTSDEKSFAVLKGLTLRIQADAPIEDLELAPKRKIDSNLRSMDDKLNIYRENTSLRG